MSFSASQNNQENAAPNEASRAPPARDVRSRRWVYTFNNPTKEIEDAFMAWNLPTWHCFGRELAPSTGTPHLQGAFVAKNAVKWSTIVARFPGIWCEPMRGTIEEVVQYCSKSDPDFFEIGERPAPKGSKGGEATAKNWELAKQLAIEGNIDEIPANIYVPYYNNILRISTRHQKKLDNLTVLDNHWYYGKSGTGKSYAARNEYGDSLYIKNINKWWDGYDGEENVLIDDIDTTHGFMGYFLKIWGDFYFFNAEIKGSTKTIRPRRLIVTSNYHPTQIFTDENILQPILRRFKVTRFANLMDQLEKRVPEENVRSAYVPGFAQPSNRVINPIPDMDDIDVNLSFIDDL